jgi:hypothetical protein
VAFTGNDRRKLAALIHVGTLMSHAAYDLGNRDRIELADRKRLLDLHGRWDQAVRELDLGRGKAEASETTAEVAPADGGER